MGFVGRLQGKVLAGMRQGKPTLFDGEVRPKRNVDFFRKELLPRREEVLQGCETRRSPKDVGAKDAVWDRVWQPAVSRSPQTSLPTKFLRWPDEFRCRKCQNHTKAIRFCLPCFRRDRIDPRNRSRNRKTHKSRPTSEARRLYTGVRRRCRCPVLGHIRSGATCNRFWIFPAAILSRSFHLLNALNRS